MLHAMIVDDEAPARSELRFLLEQTGKIGSISEASSVRSAIEMLMENRVDLDAFEVDAVDYLMKPVEADRLARALDKVQARLKPAPAAHSSVERIPVEKGGRKVLVPIDQIRYIEAKDDYSCIYTDTDRYLSTTSLAKLENNLIPHGFFRVHRGYIVNLEYVEDVEVVSSGILQLGINGIEGKKISVSRRRVVQLKRALGL